MIAIVTGASSGMGAEFCHRLDEKGLDCIWLIARRQDLLQEIASTLNTPARVIPMDLTNRENLDFFAVLIAEEKPSIQYLVDCAGFGKFGLSWEQNKGTTRSMIDLNVQALVEITHSCIPYIVKGGHIIELCSASAYIPMYDLNIYASTKAFVRHYCNGLRKELEPHGISVTEVSPGWVKTDFIEITMTEQKVPEKVFNGAVTKEDVVRKALMAADRNKQRSVCGFRNKCIVFLARLVPNFASNVWAGQFK